MHRRKKHLVVETEVTVESGQNNRLLENTEVNTGGVYEITRYSTQFPVSGFRIETSTAREF